MKQSKTKYIVIELAHHLPYSIAGVISGILFMGVLTFIAIVARSEDMMATASYELFHIFHPGHILVSAVATTAMFWKHEKGLIKTVTVGLVGSIGICGLSDIVFPFLGGELIGTKMHMHICILEHPSLILIFAVVGVIAGIFISSTVKNSTQYSHSAHVFLSSTASILYLLSFGLKDWMHSLGSVFVITIFAVMLPCCLSDIVFPLACTHKGCGCEVESDHCDKTA